MKGISIIEVEFIAHQLAKKLTEWKEPIPDFGTRFPTILERTLNAPFQKFGGEFLYKGFIRKSAVLFYLMIKNHPFQNGNKRIGMMTLFYLLYKNKKWIKVDNQELYNFAKWVAESNPKLKDETVNAAEKFIVGYIIDL